jgi:hypothetical protein
MFHGLDTAGPEARERVRRSAMDLPDDSAPEQADAWVEPAELVRGPEFRAQTRGRPSSTPPAGQTLEHGVAPEAPEAGEVLRNLLGDADRGAVPERVRAPRNVGSARHRELPAP